MDVAPLGVAHPAGGSLSPADVGHCPGGCRGFGVADRDATRLPHQPGRIAQPQQRLQPPLARIHQGVRRQGGRGCRRGRARAASRSPPRWKTSAAGWPSASDLFVAVLHETDAPKLRAKGLYYLKPEELRQIDGFLDQAGPILQGDWSPLSLGGMAHWMGAAMTGGSEAAAPPNPGGHADRIAAGDEGTSSGARAGRLVRVALAEHVASAVRWRPNRRPTA